jgi:hypothetical protein
VRSKRYDERLDFFGEGGRIFARALEDVRKGFRGVVCAGTGFGDPGVGVDALFVVGAEERGVEDFDIRCWVTMRIFGKGRVR